MPHHPSGGRTTVAITSLALRARASAAHGGRRRLVVLRDRAQGALGDAQQGRSEVGALGDGGGRVDLDRAGDAA